MHERDVLNAIQRIERVHSAQVLSYLKQTGCKVGLLFNFNVRMLLPDGFRRIVNDFPDSMLSAFSAFPRPLTMTQHTSESVST
jgi:hypothetical protein